MTSWVVTIDRKHPNHWQIAKEHSFWDLTRYRPISAGDLVYFWQAGKSLLGVTRATTDAYDLAPGTIASWEDSGQREYAARFHFEVVDETPLDQPRWVLDVGPRLTRVPDLRVIPEFDDPRDEAVLASYFDQDAGLVTVLHDILSDAGIDAPELDIDRLVKDDRRFVEQLVARRDGQAAFRRHLLAVYPRCAVTGTAVLDVLDAAHISPYSGPESNVARNGVILRRDIHRLFDRHLITITEDLHVRVSPALDETEYAVLDGKPVDVPTSAANRPASELLARHHEACAWLIE